MSPEDQMELENKIEDVCWLICKTPYIGKNSIIFFLNYESENQSIFSYVFPFIQKLAERPGVKKKVYFFCL